MRLRIYLICWLLLSYVLPVQAQIGPSVNHPERRWQRLPTAHFVFHYYQGFESLARLAAAIAESGFERIRTDLGLEYSEKIPVIITEEEFWNGYAEPARNRIVIDPRFALEPQIGLERFMLHELTHIFTFLAVQRPLPGSNLIKAAGIPAWFAEGLAQYEAESWTPEHDRMLRLHALNRSLLTPEERNAFTALSGKGAEGYNEGYALVKFLFETYGRHKLPELLRHWRQSGGGDFYQAIQRTFGQPLLQLEAAWRQSLEEQSQRQIFNRDLSLRNGQPLLPETPDRSWDQPRPSPNGKWLAFQTSGGYPLVRGHLYPFQPVMIADLKQLKTYGEQAKQRQTPVPETRPTQPPEIKQPAFQYAASPTPPPLELTKIQTRVFERAMDFDWAPDSLHLAATVLTPDAHGNSIKSIEILALTQAGEQLKAAAPPERILPEFQTHSPAWAPDGEHLALVIEEAGQDRIVLYNLLEQRLVRTLLQGSQFRQFQALRWSPDGQQLLAESFFPGEDRELIVLSLASPHTVQVLARGADPEQNNRQPVWSPDGRAIYFISTRNGFADLYRHVLANAHTEQLSTVYSGLESPAISADGQTLFYIRHHARGTVLEQAPLPGPGTQITLNPPNTPGPPRRQPVALTDPALPYEPWLAPEVAVPVISLDEKGEQIGVLTQSADLLEQHSLNLLLLYGLHSARVGYNAAYVNRMFDTTWGVEMGDAPLLSFATDGSAFFIARDQQLSVSLTRPLFNAGTGDTYATRLRRLASLEFTASYQTSLRPELSGRIEERQLRQGWNNSLSLTWNANESLRNQDGIRYALNLSAGGPWLGSQYSFVAANGNFRHYLPLFGEHLLAYRLDATLLNGETRPALLGGPPLSNLLVMNFQNIIPLRGFRLAELQGSLLGAASLEYRIPLLKDWNFSLDGHYLENLTLAAFADAGDAWFPTTRGPFLHLSTGLELRSEAVLNYRNGFSLFLGAGKALLGYQIGPTDRGLEFYGGFANVF